MHAPPFPPNLKLERMRGLSTRHPGFFTRFRYGETTAAPNRFRGHLQEGHDHYSRVMEPTKLFGPIYGATRRRRVILY